MAWAWFQLSGLGLRVHGLGFRVWLKEAETSLRGVKCLPVPSVPCLIQMPVLNMATTLLQMSHPRNALHVRA